MKSAIGSINGWYKR